jgi:hypothetical protein
LRPVLEIYVRLPSADPPQGGEGEGWSSASAFAAAWEASRDLGGAEVLLPAAAPARSALPANGLPAAVPGAWTYVLPLASNYRTKAKQPPAASSGLTPAAVDWVFNGFPDLED